MNPAVSVHANEQIITRDNSLAEYRQALLDGHRERIEDCATKVVSRYSPYVYRIALHLWAGHPNRHDLADELTQITLAKVCLKGSEYRPENRAEAWISAIAVNASRSMYRGKNSPGRIPQPFSNIIDQWSISCDEAFHLATEKTPDDQVCSRETLSRIHQEIASLPPASGEVINLLLEDYMYREIAEMLALPLGTIKSRTVRARRLLADRLSSIGIPVGQM